MNEENIPELQGRWSPERKWSVAQSVMRNGTGPLAEMLAIRSFSGAEKQLASLDRDRLPVAG